MKRLLTHPSRKVAAWAALWALAWSLPAAAAVYEYSATDLGAVPQGGTPVSVGLVISDVPASTFTSVTLTLSFNDSTSLLGNSGGLQGHLILGTSEASPYVNFYPVDNSGAGLHTYTATFSGSGDPGVGFGGLNPNNTWGVLLWDNSTSTSGIESGWAGYQVAITAVPEPINGALGVFGAVFTGVAVVRRRRAL